MRGSLSCGCLLEPMRRHAKSALIFRHLRLRGMESPSCQNVPRPRFPGPQPAGNVIWFNLCYM